MQLVSSVNGGVRPVLWGLVFALLSGLSTISHGANEAIPPSNRDLEELIEAVAAAQGVAAFCTMKCPVVDDCERAWDLVLSLKNTEELLQKMLPYLNDANAAAFAHFKSLVEVEIITADNLANVQDAIALHQFLHDFGSAMLDVASVLDFAKNAAKGAGTGALENSNPAELLSKLDSAYETMKDLESAMDTIGTAQTGKSGGTPVGDATTKALGKDVNDAKSYLSDAKSVLEEGIKEGKIDWTSIGQSLGRLTKAISKEELEARQQRLNELMNDMSAEAKARMASYLEYQKFNKRRNLAEDALAQVQAARVAVKNCLLKLCPDSSSSTARDYQRYLNTLVGGAVAEDIEYGRPTWGHGLGVLNPEIAGMTERLRRLPPVRDDCPEQDDSGAMLVREPLIVHTDSPKWCTYGGSVTAVPLTPGGQTRTRDGNGDDPRDMPETGMGGGEDESGDDKDGDDPRDLAPQDSHDNDDDDDDPRDAPIPEEEEDASAPGPKIIVKAKTGVLAGSSAGQAVSGQLVKLDFSKIPPLPGTGAKEDSGFAASPIQGVTGKDGSVTLTTPAGTPMADGQVVEVAGGEQDSTIVQLNEPYKKGRLGKLDEYVIQAFRNYAILLYPAAESSRVQTALSELGSVVRSTEPNYCRDKQQSAANDPYFQGAGSWKQKHDDQWALKRVVIRDGENAWNLLNSKPADTVVAVIDSGLDWNHFDMDWKNIWRNSKEIPGNGKDDDKNGYVDDLIGWDFWYRNNQPWDKDGHGTFVSGIIAASSNNNIGIAGMNPHAKIMVLKALNTFGHTRASFVAEAIYYAADNGARVINLSVGGKNLTEIEQSAIDYAYKKNVVIVVSSGNEGTDTSQFGPAGADKVITVASSDLKDKRTVFSNWGKAVNIAAPGVDVLSLRARRTDLMEGIPGVEYQPTEAYVGKDKRYYRASGTSFSAPLVAGAASLLLSNNPKLSNEDVKRILLNSADDIETPGVDQYTGYGILNVVAALKADSRFFIDAHINGVQVVQENGQVFVQVAGTANAQHFKNARISIGSGKNPTQWKEVIPGIKQPVVNGSIGSINANHFRDAAQWMIQLEVEDNSGRSRRNWFELNLN